ncbi:MAG TPA: 2-hydroxyacyl-CoA dehydratase, partial [Planctomycetota bacterium]|nr:2-hydroxyacyl-CoA dehydratase [Planctomycetota bacterium]
MSGHVGITTTVPIEVIYAAGLTPVDLNNRFITADDPRTHLERAETDGLPRNVCGWIRGIYGVVVADDDLDPIVGVTQGDCSNTHALMELFERAGRRVIPFAYPYDANRELLKLQIEEFMSAFGVKPTAVVATKRRLDRVRKKLVRLDELTWRAHRVTGAENHRWLVSASDMNGDPDRFEAELDAFLAEASGRPPRTGETRLGCIGVPTMFSDLYDFLESIGVRVVYNEMPRQFAMLGLEDDLVDQYRHYTYPYRVWGRIEDIRRAVAGRGLAGVIHTVQSFCYRQ